VQFLQKELCCRLFLEKKEQFLGCRGKLRTFIFFSAPITQKDLAINIDVYSTIVGKVRSEESN